MSDLVMTRSKSGNGPPVSLLTKKSKSKKKSTKKQTKKPKQQSGGSDVEDELTDASSLALTDEEADGTETRGHSDSTDADDDELEALAATVASATAEQAKQKAAAADARRRMRLLLDKSHSTPRVCARVSSAAGRHRLRHRWWWQDWRQGRRQRFQQLSGDTRARPAWFLLALWPQGLRALCRGRQWSATDARMHDVRLGRLSEPRCRQLPL